MNFHDPSWLLALPPVLSAITILYFLKLKRREIVISSSYLWREAIQDLRVNSPFQRLRMNLLLFLQLLIAALIIVALARPRAAVDVLRARDLVLLVDRSASMATRQGNETRLEQALAEAERLITDMTTNDRATIIAFDEQPEIIEPLNNSKRRLLAALERIEGRDRGTRLNDALDLAFKIALGEAEDRPREVHLFSDGVCRELGRVLSEEERDQGAVAETIGELRAKLPKDGKLRYVNVGKEAANLGITSIDLRRTLDREGLLQLFIGIANFGGEARELGVDISLDGELVESREVKLPKNIVTSVVLDSEALGEGRIEVSLDAEDALALDNRAYAIARPRQSVRVLLVTDGNRFLENALETMRFVNFRSITATELEASDPTLAQFDVVIFDRVSPKIMPSAACLFIDALPPFPRLSWGKSIEAPRIVDWNETHPVSAFVNFARLEPALMRVLALGKSDEVMVEAEGGALIAVVRERGRESVVLCFDVLKSRWPFQAGFPIFLANALRWLGGEGVRSQQLRPGEAASIIVGERQGTLRVTDPRGTAHDLPIEPGRPVATFSKTYHQGFYKVEVVRGAESEPLQDFAVNLADPIESALDPRLEFKLAGVKDPVAITGQSKAQENNREVWKLFASALLALLMVEWWIYNRRVYV